MTEMDLNVPYYSQREEAALKLYGTKACGLTSLRMVLGFYGYNFTIEQLATLAAREEAHIEPYGWIHARLIQMAREAINYAKEVDPQFYDEKPLKGFRIDFTKLGDEDLKKASELFAQKESASFDEVQEFEKIWKIAKNNKEGGLAAVNALLEKQVPVIASMKETYAGTTATHLVVIKGKEHDNYIINDPWHNGASFTIPIEEFDQEWTKRAIVIYKESLAD